MIKKRMIVFRLPMFLLMLFLLTTSLNLAVPVLLALYRYYKLTFNLHRFATKRLLHLMLLRIYWIKQIAFLYTLQATTSTLKNDVSLPRVKLRCVRAFNFEKTKSTSTTKYKCQCELGKTKRDLTTLLRELSPTKILIIFPITNILRCFDWVFRRLYRYYFSFVLKWSFYHWMILDWIALINCLIKNF